MEDERQVQVGDKRPHSPDENSSQNVATQPSTATKRARTGIPQPSTGIKPPSQSVRVTSTAARRGAKENDDLLDAADHGGSLVPELNRVMAQRIEQLHKSIMCNIDDHCNEVIKKKLVKPKVVRKEHMDQLGEITKQLRDALTEMLVKKEAFKNACIEAEGYMIKEREALRQRYEAALANQRKSVDKYQRDATDKEARLKEAEASLQSERSALRAARDDAEKAIAKVQDQLDALNKATQERDQHREGRALAEQRCGTLEKEVEAAKADLEQVRTARETVQRELTEALSKHEQASRDLARAEEARAQLQGEVQTLKEAVKQKEDALNNALSTFMETQKTNQAQHARYEADKDRVNEEKASLQSQLRDAQARLDTELPQLKAQVEHYKAAAEQAESELNEKRSTFEQMTIDFNGLQAQINELQGQLVVVTSECEAQKSRAEQLGRELEAEVAILINKNKDEIAAIQRESQAKEEQLQKELNTLREDHAALRKTLEVQTEQSQALTTELRTIRENSSVDITEQIEKLCRISVERDEMQRKLNEAGNNSMALNEAHEQIEKLKAELFKSEAERRKLHNEIQDLRGKVRVCVRVRPAKSGDGCTLNVAPDDKNVTLEYNGGKQPFAFDRVFGTSAAQSDVFEEVSHFVQSALDGYNVCLFAYGQTGAGKTHSMQGSLAGDSRGIIPRSAEKVVNTALRMRETGWEYSFVASYFEIYNETVRDLLAPKTATVPPKGLSIKTGLNNMPEVDGLEEAPIVTVDDVLTVVQRAEANRTVAGTDMNERSSRSHSVFLLKITGTHAEKNSRLTGNLYLCDLAGSERLKKSHAEGDRLKETQAINKSLSSLADIFAALKSKSAHVPYRNSKLTHILQPCLSATGKAMMLVALAPEADSAHESLCSLRFASQVSQTEFGQTKRQISAASGNTENAPAAKRPKA